MEKTDPTRQHSPSALTDAPWATVAPLLPPAHQSARGGHPRRVDMRDVRNTMFDLHRRGGPWARLPHAVRPKSTV